MLALLGLLSSSQAQSGKVIPLWPNGAPGALGQADKDVPTLTAFLPDPEKATGAAFVICPGGGYGALALHEGEHYARFLNEQGIAGFVLRYRTKPYDPSASVADVNRAVQTVRARAAEFHLSPQRFFGRTLYRIGFCLRLTRLF